MHGALPRSFKITDIPTLWAETSAHRRGMTLLSVACPNFGLSHVNEQLRTVNPRLLY